MQNKKSILIIGLKDANITKFIDSHNTKIFSITQIESFDEAESCFLENKFSLIVVDLDSVLIDKIKLGDFVLKDKHIELIPFLFLASTIDESVFECLKINYELFNYVLKPINSGLLLLKINNLIQHKEVKEELNKSKKNLNKKIIQAEISYEDLYYSLPQEILLINDKGIIVGINKSGILSFEEDVKDLIHHHYSSSRFLRKLDKVSKDFFNVHKVLNSVDFLEVKEFEYNKKNGDLIYKNVNCSLMLIGGKFHSQIMIIDITEKKKTEEIGAEIYKEIIDFDSLNQSLLRGGVAY